ncbi:MAG: cell division protein FtsQ/DivIB, partial [bacterium]
MVGKRQATKRQTTAASSAKSAQSTTKRRTKATQAIAKQRLSFAWLKHLSYGSIVWQTVTTWLPQTMHRAALAGLFLVVLGFVLWLMTWLANNDNLPIRQVSIEGDLQHLRKSTLQPVIDEYTKTNLAQLDVVGLEQALENQPWVLDASITKRWPSTLVIKLREHKPVAYWGENQLLSRYGQVFSAQLNFERKDFPMLYSPSGDGLAMGKQYLAILQQLQSIPDKVIALTENERGSWDIRFQSGLLLKVGKKDKNKRLKRFVVAYHKTLKARIDDMSKVDL